MDDMYQYTAAAVNSNAPSSAAADEDNDVILKAFTNFGWGQRFNSLVNTVKKQSEVIVEVTKKDLQEFAQVIREDVATREPKGKERAESEEEISNSSSSSVGNGGDAAGGSLSLSSLRESLSKINPQQLTSSLSQAINDAPAQLTSMKLPDNINLGQLRQEMAQGTRFAEQYMQKFGTEIMQVLSKTITVLEPESDEEQAAAKGLAGQRIFASRKDALLAKMRLDPDTYLVDPANKVHGDQETKVLETFNAGFNVQDYTDEIARILEELPELREMMDGLVPVEVSYATFWQRYFYHAWKVEQDEQKRQLIVKGAEADEDDTDFKWDSDDEEADKTVPAEERNTTPKPKNDGKGSDTDFSNISEAASTEASLISPPLKSQTDGEDWVKAEKSEKKKEAEAEVTEESDSDWE
ncbi:hypothetical protein DFQ28_008755 [Apophysomyces sp. BC1034]|nr:hypothetical protein DFQ30_004974 [Apophysomyces sp. BC1015]KAG0174558.1 hypothetical protein DFQ29_007439 [Apophysomyces sp. BC1021]KAG0185794.1 hypothetical protein DFQ28_008755 [Apophysomyces sp. BC1034]